MAHYRLDAAQSRRWGLTMIAAALLVVFIFGLTGPPVFFALVLMLPGVVFALPDRIMDRLAGRPGRDGTGLAELEAHPSLGGIQRRRSYDTTPAATVGAATLGIDSFGNSEATQGDSSSSDSSDSGGAGSSGSN